MVIYDKGIQDKFEIKKPDALTDNNPQGKVPVLVDHKSGMKVPESDTILRWIVDKYAGTGPDYRPSTLEGRLIGLSSSSCASIKPYRITPPIHPLTSNQQPAPRAT